MTRLSAPLKTLHHNLDRAGAWLAPLPLPLRSPAGHAHWELSMWAELLCALAILLAALVPLVLAGAG